MAGDENLHVPEGLCIETADALKHLYDYAFLARHPILRRLRGQLGDDPAQAVLRLRGLLVALIEEMRPRSDVRADNPAWRPYQVLYNRYVLGKELEDLESELGLGRRQIQREQQQGFAEVALKIWTRDPASGKGGEKAGVEALSQEISRAATEEQVFDACEQLARALASVKPLAESHRVELSDETLGNPISVLGDPLLFRQLLVSALSFLLRLPAVHRVQMDIEHQGKEILCSLAATGELDGQPPSVDAELPEALLALAGANHARIGVQPVSGGYGLSFCLPAAKGEWTIAIVEDNRDLVALFSRYLAKQGYRVLEINDPRVALDRIAVAMPDALVLDVMMSAVDGWEILQRVRADSRLRHLPVAICSVLDEAELATSLGADAYLRKPVRPAQLVECLSSLLHRQHSGPAGLSLAGLRNA
jgi:CheY-like chemotaxis protein